MSFLRRVAGRTLRDRVRSFCHTGVEPLLLHIERNQLRLGSDICSGCLLDVLSGEYSGLVPPEEAPGKTQGHAEGTMSLSLLGNALGFPRRSWRKCLGRGKSGVPCWDCCPHDPASDKRLMMDGWMLYFSDLLLLFLIHCYAFWFMVLFFFWFAIVFFFWFTVFFLIHCCTFLICCYGFWFVVV